MIFELFGMIFGIITFTSKIAEEGERTSNNRNDAIQDHKPYYYTAGYKRRSTSTDEVVAMQYLGGHKLVGVKTGKVYKDYDKEKEDIFIKKRNKALKAKNSPVFLKQCPEYYNHKTHKYSTVHLYEKSTGRPYDVISRVGVKNGINSDDTVFTISYLDEKNKMKPVGEYAYLPKKYYTDYCLGI